MGEQITNDRTSITQNRTKGQDISLAGVSWEPKPNFQNIDGSECQVRRRHDSQEMVGGCPAQLRQSLQIHSMKVSLPHQNDPSLTAMHASMRHMAPLSCKCRSCGGVASLDKARDQYRKGGLKGRLLGPGRKYIPIENRERGT